MLYFQTNKTISKYILNVYLNIQDLGGLSPKVPCSKLFKRSKTGENGFAVPITLGEIINQFCFGCLYSILQKLLYVILQYNVILTILHLQVCYLQLIAYSQCSCHLTLIGQIMKLHVIELLYDPFLQYRLYSLSQTKDIKFSPHIIEFHLGKTCDYLFQYKADTVMMRHK